MRRDRRTVNSECIGLSSVGGSGPTPRHANLPGRFRQAIASLGSLPPGSPDEIDATLTRLYGADLDQLEQTWLHSLRTR